MTDELSNVKRWFDKLSVNVEKMQCILFRGHMTNVQINVKLNSMDIMQTNTLKLLGIYIDSEVNWVKHIDMLCKDLSKVSYMINIFKYILPTWLRKSLSCLLL